MLNFLIIIVTMSRYKWDELVVLKENKDYPIEQEGRRSHI